MTNINNVAMQLSAGHSATPVRALLRGARVEPLSVGSRGDWRVDAPGVQALHLALWYDGTFLWAAALPGCKVQLNAQELGVTYSLVPPYSELTFGDARIRVAPEVIPSDDAESAWNGRASCNVLRMAPRAEVTSGDAPTLLKSSGNSASHSNRDDEPTIVWCRAGTHVDFTEPPTQLMPRRTRPDSARCRRADDHAPLPEAPMARVGGMSTAVSPHGSNSRATSPDERPPTTARRNRILGILGESRTLKGSSFLLTAFALLVGLVAIAHWKPIGIAAPGLHWLYRIPRR